MPGKNKNPILGWHPPAELSAWVRAEAARCNVTVSVILNEAIQALRERVAAEFEAAYAARSGVTVEFLHQWGRYAEHCDCGEPECEGWAMGHQHEDAIIEDRLTGG